MAAPATIGTALSAALSAAQTAQGFLQKQQPLAVDKAAIRKADVTTEAAISPQLNVQIVTGEHARGGQQRTVAEPRQQITAPSELTAAVKPGGSVGAAGELTEPRNLILLVVIVGLLLLLLVLSAGQR